MRNCGIFQAEAKEARGKPDTDDTTIYFLHSRQIFPPFTAPHFLLTKYQSKILRNIYLKGSFYSIEGFAFEDKKWERMGSGWYCKAFTRQVRKIYESKAFTKHIPSRKFQENGIFKATQNWKNIFPVLRKIGITFAAVTEI